MATPDRDAEFPEDAGAAPTGPIDADRARAGGRRRVPAARPALIGGGVAAVVAACALLVNGLGGASPAKAGPGATAGAGTGAGAVAGAGPQFTGTDPLASVARFGWLPQGLVAGQTSSGPDEVGDQVTARAENSVRRTLALEKVAFEPRPAADERKTPVSVAGSRNAFVISRSGSAASVLGDVTLAWQTASGSWYTLQGDTAVHGAQLQAELIRVAETATIGETAVPLPVHVAGLPEGMTADGALLSDPVQIGADGFSAELIFRVGGPDAGGAVVLSASPIGLKAPVYITEVVIGSPGSTRSPGSSPTAKPTIPHICKDSNGLHICVTGRPTSDDDPQGPVRLRELLDHVTSLGTNRADWTTHVVG